MDLNRTHTLVQFTIEAVKPTFFYKVQSYKFMEFENLETKEKVNSMETLIHSKSELTAETTQKQESHTNSKYIDIKNNETTTERSIESDAFSVLDTLIREYDKAIEDENTKLYELLLSCVDNAIRAISGIILGGGIFCGVLLTLVLALVQSNVYPDSSFFTMTIVCLLLV